MSDEEKSIEEIIAELESLEKQAKEEEEKQASPKDDEMSEELSLEEPSEVASSEEPLVPPGEVQAEKSEYEDVFMEEPPDKPSIEIEIEELSDEISLKEGIDEKTAESTPSDEDAIGELSLEEPLKDLTLEEPLEMQASKDEDVMGGAQERIDEEKREDSGDFELSLETEDISLEELSPEEQRGEPTVDISAEVVRDDESFEILQMEQDADEVSLKEQSFDDVFNGTSEDRPSEAHEEAEAVFGDQTVKLTVDEVQMEHFADNTDLYLSGEKLHEEVPSTEPIIMSSGGEPPEKPPTDETGDIPPDEPPMPPPKAKTPLRLSRVAVLLGLFLVAVVLYGIFVWPKLYEYRTVKSGDVKYQVKINRITKTQQYFDAGSWHRGSIPKQISQVARHKIEPKPDAGAEEAKAVVKESITTAQDKQEVQANVPVQATPPAKVEPQVEPQEKGSSEVQVVTADKVPVESPAKPSEVASQIPDKTTVQSGAEEVKEPEPQKAEQTVTAVPVKEELPQTQEPAKTVKTKQYVIQLSTMRFEEFADELVNNLRKKGWSVYKDSVKGKDKEPWYRVFLGGFASRGSAAAFMKEKSIEKKYPGSFIRSAYLSSAAAEE